jgi:hypothetical protein
MKKISPCRNHKDSPPADIDPLIIVPSHDGHGFKAQLGHGLAFFSAHQPPDKGLPPFFGGLNLVGFDTIRGTSGIIDDELEERNALFGQLFRQDSHGGGYFLKRGSAKFGIRLFHLAVSGLGNTEFFSHLRLGYFFIFSPCTDHAFAVYHIGTDNGMGDGDFPIPTVHQLQILVIRNDGKEGFSIIAF